MEEKNIPKPNLIEMAKKRRHLHLVEKLAKGKSATPSLSKSEIRELENLEGDPNSPGIVDSQEKVAKIFGVATRTVERWIREGMPVTRDRKYDLFDIRAWRGFKKQKPNKNNSAQNRKDSAEADYREYKAKMAEIHFKKMIGQLIPKETIEKELIQISMGIKQALLALPQQVAPQLVGLEVRQINVLLTDRIKEAIQDIADGKALAKKIKDEPTSGNFNNLDTTNT